MSEVTVYQQKENSIRSYLHKNMNAIKAAMAEEVDVKYICRVALTTITQNRDLLNCTEDSLISGIIKSTQCGLSLDNNLGEAYLIPRNNTRKGVKEANFQTGYQGILKLIWNTGLIKSLTCECVLHGDTFRHGAGTDPFVHHIPNYDNDISENKDNLKYIYVVFELMTGGKIQKIMSLKQLEVHRKKYSKTKYEKGKVWFDDYIAMAKKTVLLQAAKYLPKSPKDKNQSLAKAVSIEETQHLPQKHINITPQVDSEPQSNLDELVNSSSAIEPPKEEKQKKQKEPRQKEFFSDEQANADLDLQYDAYRKTLVSKIGQKEADEFIFGLIGALGETVFDGLTDKDKQEVLTEIAKKSQLTKN
jgi:recombination protein RecT